MLFKRASLEVAIVSCTCFRPLLEDIFSGELRILGHLRPTWSVKVHLLVGTLEGPMAHLQTLLALLSAFHVCTIADSVRHIVWLLLL